MRKEKKSISETGKIRILEPSALSLTTDQEILEYINKRKEENLALKKILDNFNNTFPETNV